jgi:hypothetical protein
MLDCLALTDNPSSFLPQIHGASLAEHPGFAPIWVVRSPNVPTYQKNVDFFFPSREHTSYNSIPVYWYVGYIDRDAPRHIIRKE